MKRIFLLCFICLLVSIAAVHAQDNEQQTPENNETVIDLSRRCWSETSPVTDAGMEHLKGLRNLIRLKLSDTQKADAGLVHLKGLTALKGLELGNTKMTDAGLEQLKGLTALWVLEVTGTKVTEEGVKKICEALPHCEIFR
jgi:hypothetical protein